MIWRNIASNFLTRLIVLLIAAAAAVAPATLAAAQHRQDDEEEDDAPEDQREDRSSAPVRGGRLLLLSLERALLGLLGRCLQLLDDRVGARLDAAGIVVLSEARQDLVVDDQRRQGVGEDRL